MKGIIEKAISFSMRKNASNKLDTFIRGIVLFFALNGLRGLAEGIKITQLAALHSRIYGAIKARILKLALLQKQNSPTINAGLWI